MPTLYLYDVTSGIGGSGGVLQYAPTFYDQIAKLANSFGIKDVTMVGNRGMINSCQIKELDAVKLNYITPITKA